VAKNARRKARKSRALN